MADVDYYNTLGVSRTATADEIRKAYRKLSRENHPDAKKDDPEAAKRFKEVQEAYGIVGDPTKREQYDRFGAAYFAAGGGRPGPTPQPGGGGRTYTWNTGGEGGFDFNDIFGGGFEIDELLGGGRRGGRPGGRAPGRGGNVEASVRVPFLTAARGGQMDLQVDLGTGPQTLTVRIPAGVNDGSVIRLAGQGHPGRGGGASGDLLLTVEVEPHPYFRRDGSDVLVDVPITPAEAVLGAKVDAPTLSDGQVMVTVPPGTSSGMKLRLRSKGITDPQTKQTGDQYVVIKIVVPKELPPATKELYRQLAATDESPRKTLWS